MGRSLCPDETETDFFDRGGYGVHVGRRVVVPRLLNRVRVFLRRTTPRSLYNKTVERSLSEFA